VYAGKSITVNIEIEQSGTAIKGTSQFVGTHTSGGTFSGTLTALTHETAYYYSSCGVIGSGGGGPIPIPDPQSGTCTISCSMENTVPVYTITFSTFTYPMTNLVYSTTTWEYNVSLSSNCGQPTCSSGNAVTCNSTYSSNCTGISHEGTDCYEPFLNADCTGDYVGVGGIHYSRRKLTATIA